MVRFHQHYGRALTVLTVIFALMLAATAASMIVFFFHRMPGDDARHGFRLLNTLVTATQTYDGSSSPDQERRVLDAASELKTLLPESVRTEALGTLLEAPVAGITEGDPTATIHLAANLLNDYYYRQDRRDHRTITLYVITLLVLVFAAIIVAVRMRCRYSEIIRHVGLLLERVGGLVDNSRRSLDIAPRWEEERVLIEAAERITQSVRDDRETASEWMYGTLEAFMP